MIVLGVIQVRAVGQVEREPAVRDRDDDASVVDEVVVGLALCRVAGYAVLRLGSGCRACLRVCVVVVKSA
jgi:hypothetical protein